jgi:hypothetical protein
MLPPAAGRMPPLRLGPLRKMRRRRPVARALLIDGVHGIRYRIHRRIFPGAIPISPRSPPRGLRSRWLTRGPLTCRESSSGVHARMF